MPQLPLSEPSPIAYRGMHLAGSSVREENHCALVGTPAAVTKGPSELHTYWWQVGADGCLCSGAANSFRKQAEAMEAGVVLLLAAHKRPSCCSEQAAAL